MGGRGAAPKDPSKLHPRSKPGPAPTMVSADGEVRGPDLPDGITWPDPTLHWWETWRRSPQAQKLTDTDWDFLVDTALLHARFWTGDTKVAGELRLRVAKFGATPEDRMRLRMQIEDPDPTKPAVGEQQGRYGHLRPVKQTG